MKTTTDNQTFPVPKPVYLLLDRLCSSGYEAYLVGGCVRDLLLGAIPHDFDVTTSAPPHRVQQLFHGYALSASGIRFGTVGVKTDCGMVEITTFRTEGSYEDGRHPGQVQFGGGLKNDLLRRDFLMNAVCLTKDGVLLDPLGGVRDILEKRITACGNPAARFREDALRVLRGVRFACQLGFTVEHATLAAMREAAAALSNLPVERLSGELCRLLLSPAPSRLFTEFSWCLSPLFPAFHLNDPDRLDLLPAALPERLLPLPQLAQGLQLPRADRARLAQLKEIWDLLPVPDRQAARLLSCRQDADTVHRVLYCYDLYHNTRQSSLFTADDAARTEQTPISGRALVDMGFQGKEIGLILSALRRRSLLPDEKPGEAWWQAQRALLSDTAAVFRLIPARLRPLCGAAPFSKNLLPVRSRARLPEHPASVLLFALPYYSASAAGGNLSKYASVPDYHQVVPALLGPVADALEAAFPGRRFQVFTDSSPNREVALAAQAGLGSIGDNGLLLHPKYGSFVFLGEIVTDLPLFFFAQPVKGCLHCGRCRTACPVGLDKTRCVSALTQKKGALTEEEQALVKAGGLVWGCDKCQDCCPCNQGLPNTPLSEFKDAVIPVLTRDMVDELVHTRAFGFRGPSPLHRNLALFEEEKKA